MVLEFGWRTCEWCVWVSDCVCQWLYPALCMWPVCVNHLFPVATTGTLTGWLYPFVYDWLCSSVNFRICIDWLTDWICGRQLWQSILSVVNCDPPDVSPLERANFRPIKSNVFDTPLSVDSWLLTCIDADFRNFVFFKLSCLILVDYRWRTHLFVCSNNLVLFASFYFIQTSTSCSSSNRVVQIAHPCNILHHRLITP